MLKRLFYIKVAFICCIAVNAQGHFTYDNELKAIYNDIIELQLDKAKSAILKYKSEHPNNLATLHIENYLDFFKIFISENELLFKALEENKKIRVKQIEDSGDKNSPYYYFSLAEIELQWALIRAKFNQLFKSGREIYKAYNYLEKNKRKFPDFKLTNKSLSIIHSLIETISIPGIFRSLLGIEGSVALGLNEIESLLSERDIEESLFFKESLIINAYILFYQSNEKEKAWEILNNPVLDPARSPLAQFVIAKIAQRSGYNDRAIEILELEKDTSSTPFHFLHFQLGLSKLRKLDPGARNHLLKFCSEFKGQHYLKEAYQKLAWYEIAIEENIVGYKKYMSKVITEGRALVDDDKQAVKEAKSNLIPHPQLLSARLLYDGGYYTQAYNLLIKKSHLFPKGSPHYVEYQYRLARITHALFNYRDALQYYAQCYNLGFHLDSYYACNSSLQMALIFEEQQNYALAKRHFDKCLSLSPQEYKASLHQKAKSGLNRIKKNISSN